jgi:hypothetical protein
MRCSRGQALEPRVIWYNIVRILRAVLGVTLRTISLQQSEQTGQRSFTSEAYNILRQLRVAVVVAAGLRRPVVKA